MKVSAKLRQELKQALDELCERFGARAAHELADAFAQNPYPTLSGVERGENIVNHEIFKISNQRKLRVDGSPRKRRRATGQAVGKLCPLCDKPILPSDETERHHRFYDGRPTEIVHTKCHKEQQPH
jgi:hypothetical protein